MLLYSDFGSLKKVISEYIEPSDNFQNDVKTILDNPEFDKKIGKFSYDLMGNSGVIHKLKFFQDFAKTGSNITMKELLWRFVNFNPGNNSEISGGGNSFKNIVSLIGFLLIFNRQIRKYSTYIDNIGSIIYLLLNNGKEEYQKIIVRYIKRIIFVYLRNEFSENDTNFIYYLGGKDESGIKNFIDSEIRKSGISLKSPESEIDLFSKILFSKILLKVKSDPTFAREVITGVLETGLMIPERDIRDEIKNINPDLVVNGDFYDYYENSHNVIYDYAYPKSLFLNRDFQIFIIVVLVIILILIFFIQKTGILFGDMNKNRNRKKI